MDLLGEYVLGCPVLLNRMRTVNGTTLYMFLVKGHTDTGPMDASGRSGIKTEHRPLDTPADSTADPEGCLCGPTGRRRQGKGAMRGTLA